MPLTIVDMACGTGAVTRLIVEEMACQGRLEQTRILGVDPSAEALRRAQKSMEGIRARGIKAKTEFIQGEADHLPTIIHAANVAFFCNAIHLVPDKPATFQQMASILTRGGIFACNSVFYQGSYVEGTERFYRLWTRKAIAWLRQEHPEVRVSRNGKAIAMQWLTPVEYVQQLKEGGFGEVEVTHATAPISLDAWRDLGQYWLFIEGALPGVPLALGAEALEVAVYQAGQEVGLTEVPRTWLQLVATKS
jgi:ubiquinone/menaquinone biosynthesis C-methylase UbiE